MGLAEAMCPCIFLCLYTYKYLCMHIQLLVRIPFISSVHRQQMFQINSSSWNSDALDRNWTPHQVSNHSSVSGNHYTSATYMYSSMTQTEMQKLALQPKLLKVSFFPPICKSALFHLMRNGYAHIQSCSNSSDSQHRKDPFFLHFS